jgi:hypothetical protein
MEITKEICPRDKSGTTFRVTGISLPEIAIQISLIAGGRINVIVRYFDRKMTNYNYCLNNSDYKNQLTEEMARDINLIFHLRGKKEKISSEQLLQIVEHAYADKISPADIEIYFN